MFMVTLEKRNLRRALAVVLVGAVACGIWYGKQQFQKTGEKGGAAVQISTTEDIQTYFTGYGITIDQATLIADKVQVPTSWDDSFIAFNELVAQSGYDLAAVKGETVEKWVAEIPAQCTGEITMHAVILLREGKAVGAYLLEKPSGAVTGLEDAVAVMAELLANAAADSGSALTEGGAPAQQGEEGTEASADVIEEMPPEIDVSLEVELEPNKDGFPVE